MLLSTKYSCWFHKDINNWDISSYYKFIDFNDINDFLNIDYSLNKTFTSNYFHIVPTFIFKSDIAPCWEDPNNIGGSIISIKIECNEIIDDIWKHLVCYFIGGIFADANGISISVKKSNTYIIKLWLKKYSLREYNSDKNNIKILESIDFLKNNNASIVVQKNN